MADLLSFSPEKPSKASASGGAAEFDPFAVSAPAAPPAAPASAPAATADDDPFAGSGAIDKSELQEFFTDMGINMDKEDLEYMINQMDDDGSGEIEFNEFAQVLVMINSGVMSGVAQQEKGREPSKGRGNAPSPALHHCYIILTHGY